MGLDKHFFVIAFLVFSSLPSFASDNPAAIYCQKLGYIYEVVSTGLGEQGICRFSPERNDFCDEWDFYSGACASDRGDDNLKAEVAQESKTEDSPPTGSFMDPVLASSTSKLNLPSAFDWRDYGMVTPPKNQGTLGSCMAFVAVGAMESSYLRSNKPTLIDLSEQDLISCGWFGRTNQWSQDFFNYLKDSGITDEAHFRYYGSYVPCSVKKSGYEGRIYKISEWLRVQKEDLKSALYSSGPLYVNLDASPMSGNQPPGKDGVFRCGGNKGTNHVVLLVGYNDLGKYWIIKNSWGSTSGPDHDGFEKLAYNDCSFGTNAFSVTRAYFAGSSSGSSEECMPKMKDSGGIGLNKISLGGYSSTVSVPLTNSDLSSSTLAYLQTGKNYPLIIDSFKYSQDPNDNIPTYARAWIDFDGNGDFSDSELILDKVQHLNGMGSFETTVTIPADAKKGDIKMRIYLSSATSGSAPGPCDSRDRGLSRDYGVSISDNLAQCGPIDGVINLKSDVISKGNCFEIQADNVILNCEGHKITYATEDPGYGIFNKGHKNVLIKNCNIVQGDDSSDSTGIYFYSGADNANIIDNKIILSGDNSHGIDLRESSAVTLSKNMISSSSSETGGNNNQGIRLDKVKSSTLLSNTIELDGKNTNAGIYIGFSDSNTISSNKISVGSTFSSFNDGSSPQHSNGIFLLSSSQNKILLNEISCRSAFGRGISIESSAYQKYSYNNLIESNTLVIEGDESGGLLELMSIDILKDNKISIRGKYGYGISSDGGLISSQNDATSKGPVNILRNDISAEGENVFGIMVSVAEGGSARDNQISLKGERSKGISVSRLNSASIAGNNIFILGDNSTGIFADEGLNNLDFSGNSIEISGKSISGINYHKSLDCGSNNFFKNLISLEGSDCTGFYALNQEKFKFESNTLKLNCKKGFGMGVDVVDSKKADILRNIIVVSGKEGRGIYLDYSSENTLKENKIETKDGYALAFAPSTNKEDFRNTIDTTNTEQGKPIYYFFDQPNLDIKSKIADIKNIGELLLVFCDNSKVENLEIDGDGVVYLNAKGTTISKCKVEYDGCGVSGIYFMNAEDVTVSDTLVKSNCKEDEDTASSDFPNIPSANCGDGTCIFGETVESCPNDCPKTGSSDDKTSNEKTEPNPQDRQMAEVSLMNTQNVVFTNVFFSTVRFYDDKSDLTRRWYLDLTVTDKDKKPVSQSGVSCNDKDNKPAFALEKTNSEGKINKKILLEYKQEKVKGFNPTEGKTLSTPYTLEIEKDGYKKYSEAIDFKECYPDDSKETSTPLNNQEIPSCLEKQVILEK